jgi:fibronectin-binding autotransporter adhesin
MSASLFASQPRAKRSSILFAAVASVLAMAGWAQSAVFVWGNAAGGSYSTSANWVPLGPPGAADTARFNLNSNYTVSFAATTNVSLFDVLDGTVSLTASGAARNYNATTTTLHGGDVVLSGATFPITLLTVGGLTINSDSHLNVNQGNVASSAALNLGTIGAGAGTAVVDGLGSTLNTSGLTSVGLNGATGVLTFQNNAGGSLAALDIATSTSVGGAGTFSVLSGADVTGSGAIRIGTGGVSGQSGSFTVGGSGSTFIHTGTANMTVGGLDSGTGTLTIGSGGTFTTNTAFYEILPTGTVNIAGTFNLNGNLDINGGTVNRQSGSTFTMGSLSHINLNQGGHFNLTGTLVAPSSNGISLFGTGVFMGGGGSILTLNNNSQFVAGGGATVSLSGGLNVGLIGTGAVAFIDEVGTSFSSGPIKVGSGGGSGTLTFASGATAGASSVSIGESGANSNGTLNVQTGAHLTPSALSVGATGSTGAVGVVNVQDPGSILWPSGFSPSITVGSSSDASGTINVTAGGTLNEGTNRGSCVSASTGSGTFLLNPTGTLNINGGRVAVGTIDQEGGNLIFSSGKFGYSGDLTVGAGGLLGTNLTLSSNRALANDGVTTVLPGSTLTLNGGEFGTASLQVNGAFLFNSGALGICGSGGLGFNSTDLFGTSFTLGTGRSIFVGSATTLPTGSALTIDGGDFTSGSLNNSGSLNLVSGSFLDNFGLFTNNAAGRFFIERNQAATLAGGLSNAGRVELAGGNARLVGSSTFTNSGLLLGGGEVALSVVNSPTGEIRAEAGQRLLISGANPTSAGVINAFGGTVEFTSALTSTGQINLVGGTAKFGGLLTNNGVISGRGIITANVGVTNNGQVQLSAGLTDIFGNVTSNSASKIILSGGGTASFYNNVTMNSGSEFRVSTASTAVFFGNLSGSNFFAGSGVKDFEGGSSTLGAVSTTGSTIAQAPASITASFFRENALIVAGHVTIDASGGTSHLNQLDIESGGVLDLKNNSLVLEAGDLQAITAQIRSGLNSGTGIVSTAPANPFRLGSMSNRGTIYSSFQGISGLDGDEVLIRYTRVGDLNLDGTVTISDFIDLASNFNHAGGATWQMGDVNYDGSVTISDFIDLASNFNQSVSGDALPISGEDATMLADFAAENGVSAVPEPSCLLMIPLAAFVFRRRRSKLPLARLDKRGVP